LALSLHKDADACEGEGRLLQDLCKPWWGAMQPQAEADTLVVNTQFPRLFGREFEPLL